MITIKLDHSQKMTHKSFYISDNRADELVKIRYKILSEKNTTTLSETVEGIWNNKETTILEKLFMIFAEGRGQGVK